MYDVLVIGCGVVGASIAYSLSKQETRVLVVDAENDVCNQTSKANSAIVHAGYDPEPGTLMAKYNLEGNRMMPELCKRLDVPFAGCGSLVVAFSDEEKPHLEALLARGQENGVAGLRLISGDEARKLEPNLAKEVLYALDIPSGGIVDPWELTLALAETAVQNGVELKLNTTVTAIAPMGDGYTVRTNQGDFDARYVVNAAGVFAGTIHEMVAPKSFGIIPTKGEYLLLDNNQGALVSRTIFQCPTKAGKGVLVSPTTHGNLITGPTSDPVDDPTDVSTTQTGMDKVRQFAAKSVPSVDFRQTIRNFAGLRANNADKHDFVIEFAAGHPHFLDVACIQSPGLTSAPAIGDAVARMLADAGLAAKAKATFTDQRKHVRFKHLSADEKNALIAKDPRYGRVICRCQTITEGEIVDAIHRPIVPRSLDAIKRRVTAGMGRCQGGFCGPRVLEILSRELGEDPLNIPQDKVGSDQLIGVTKGGARA